MKMAEYIEREKLLSHLFNKQNKPLDVMREITEFPAADVAPVKHGKWGAYEAFPLTASLNGHPCSECGIRFFRHHMEQEEEA